MVGRMMMDFGVTVSQLNECLCAIPIFEENITALKMAQSAGAMNFILSDANQHYISIILDHHNISSSFMAVETNLSCIEDVSLPSSTSVDEEEEAGGGAGGMSLKRLRISPHQPAGIPHACALCPHNLCKGNVLDQWRDQHSFAKVVYVGDGGGDFCPALRLKDTDVVLCRLNYPLHKKCCLAAKAKAQSESEPESESSGGSGSELSGQSYACQQQIQASVLQWSSGQDILSFFQDIF